MGVCWTLKMPPFPSYFATTSKPYFRTLPYFIVIFITKYLLYASWLIIMVFLCFNVLKMILLSFSNDGFISFTKLQEFLVAVTYKLGTGSLREPEPHYFMIFSKVQNLNLKTCVISWMVPLA